MSPAPRASNPEVSVLMSCYNASRWLREAIDSILAQTFENLELILIDDGSTDGSWNIIRHYSECDARIVAICKKNSGLADSLNVGIGRAKGAWIARLDADDLIEPTRLEDQLNYVRSSPQVVLLGTGCAEIDEQCRVIKNHVYPSSHRELVRHLENMRRFIPHSSAFFRREVAQDAGCYNPLFRKSQDWELWLRLSERGKIACMKNCLVKVRRHPSQISHSTDGMAQLVYGTAATACHFLRGYGFPDPSTSNDETMWREFISWIDRRVMEECGLEMSNAWTKARADYINANNKISGALGFGVRLLRSGYAFAVVRQMYFGSSLPKRLSREWMKRSCAAS